MLVYLLVLIKMSISVPTDYFHKQVRDVIVTAKTYIIHFIKPLFNNLRCELMLQANNLTLQKGGFQKSLCGLFYGQSSFLYTWFSMSLCDRDVIYLLKLVDVLLLTELSFQYILRFYGGKTMGVKLPGNTAAIFSFVFSICSKLAIISQQFQLNVVLRAILKTSIQFSCVCSE